MSATVRLTTAQALVRFLQAQWSERDGERRRAVPGVLGIFGHGNVCGLGDALAHARQELPLLQGKNEQSMVHVALGYAKASRRLATLACTASIGPGATNLVSGAATATINRLPVLLLPADTFATRRAGTILQQLEHPCEVDVSVNDCLRPVSRLFDRIARPEQLVSALPQAMRVLLDPAETGAVTLALHQDVQAEAHDFPARLFDERVWTVARRPPARAELAAAVGAIAQARRPLLIAGGGVHYAEATAALASFARRFGIPVAETSAGLGALDPDDPLALGGIGVNGTSAANAAARAADVVVCVGTRLTDFTTASLSLFADPDVRFVGVNVAAIDAHKLGATPLVADAREALVELERELAACELAVEARWREQLARERRSWRETLAADLAPREGERMSQGQVLRALERQAQAGDWVVAGAGSPPGDLLRLWRCAPGTSAHVEFGFSCMGHELPAALGIRMARPDAGEIHVVIGDGTYLMANGELLTALQEGLKITVVLIVNHGYQSIHGLQRGATGESFANEFRVREQAPVLAGAGGSLDGAVLEVDYVAHAASYGCAAFRARTLDELRDGLVAARADPLPALIACEVEPHRLLVGAGAFWDLGVPQVSSSEATRALAADRAERAMQQRSLI